VNTKERGASAIEQSNKIRSRKGKVLCSMLYGEATEARLSSGMLDAKFERKKKEKAEHNPYETGRALKGMALMQVG